jgi:hypothetical protein
MSGLTVKSKVHFQRHGHGCPKRLMAGENPAPKLHVGRIPRVARLMALAIRFEGLLRQGDVRDYAEIARLANVTRARVSQIMNLLLLAPDIQESILFLEPIEKGRDTLLLKHLQPIALEEDWEVQGLQFRRLVG